jgi:RimJ/RimL family protein N-acetyltransferase
MDTWIYCLADNHASMRGIEKAGFELRARMTRVCALGLRRYRVQQVRAM